MLSCVLDCVCFDVFLRVRRRLCFLVRVIEYEWCLRDCVCFRVCLLVCVLLCVLDCLCVRVCLRVWRRSEFACV